MILSYNHLYFVQWNFFLHLDLAPEAHLRLFLQKFIVESLQTVLVLLSESKADK